MLKVAFYMNIGLRNNQEDCIFINGEIHQVNDLQNVQIKEINNGISLFAVCDGMGGLSKGELASKFVCEKLKEEKPYLKFSKEYIRELFRNIQKEFLKTGLSNSGTTTSGVMIKDYKSLIFNAGDSRVYKLNKNTIQLLSHDHSYVQHLIDLGYISSDEARYHPYKNVIEFGIGDVFEDVWKSGNEDIFLFEDFLEKGESYFLSTDGVHGVMSESEIFYFLMDNPIENAEKLKDELLKRREDNLSFVIIHRQ
jgi:serine/threonine protein phosphatase PrpC